MRARGSIYFRLLIFFFVMPVMVVSIHTALFLILPASSKKVDKEVLIAEGSSFRAVSEQLVKEGIVAHKETFVAIGKAMGVTKSIRAGFYSLNTGMRPLEVLDYLKKGRIIEYQVVVPEGYTMDKVADILRGTGLVSKDEFLSKAHDPAYVRSLGLEGGTLEGYLFPATYFLPKGITPDGIIKRMVTKYKEVMGDALKARAAEIGMTERQALILASLVEREACLDSERLLVSAVFHNRLKVDMPLQCDSTIIYGMQQKGIWNGDITKADLKRKDPYNTYVYRGLPPGPIANPGRPSIMAALYPADVDYIFFVSRNDGTHFFSRNLAEHNRAVREYQTPPEMKGYSSAGGPGSRCPKAPS
jgi:UPF0755 protein